MGNGGADATIADSEVAGFPGLLEWRTSFAEEVDGETPPDSAGRLPRQQKKEKKRAERASRRQMHESSNTKSLLAVLDVLRALPAAVPSLGRALRQPPQTGTREDAQCECAQASAASTRKSPPDVTEVGELLDAAEEVLKIERPYRSLPIAVGPSAGPAILEQMIERPPKYQEKYCGQEISLLTKIWALAGAPSSTADPNATPELAIVDIGAGNGSLAILAAVMLNGVAVLIDHTLPPVELRVEDKVPDVYKSRILRINGDIADLDGLRDVEPVLVSRGISRAIIVAKHLCGVGTDAALHFVHKWQIGKQAPSPCTEDIKVRVEEAQATAECAVSASIEVTGAIFATCCGHKIGAADRFKYAEMYTQDPYLQRIVDRDTDRLHLLLALCTRCVAWRTTAGALGNRITEAQVRVGELFEDALQQPRLNTLRRLFPAATEVAFVKADASPQNRCLLAGSADAVDLACGTTGDAKALFALSAAQKVLFKLVGGPIDLKPKGFVSKKYAYDGM